MTGGGPARPPVALIVPVLDEAEAIGPVVREVPRDWVDEVVVVDGGSRDNTVEVATAAGARVLSLNARGYGRACLAGAQAVAPGTEILVFLDGDGSDRADLIPLLVGPIARGAADFVVGSRARGERERGSMSWHQLVAGRLAGVAIRRLYGVRYTDMGPFRAIRRDALATLGMRELTYGWNIEMQMRAARAGLRCLEVPVAHRRRLGGVSKVAGSLKGSLQAGARILLTVARVASQNAAPPARDPRP